MDRRKNERRTNTDPWAAVAWIDHGAPERRSYRDRRTGIEVEELEVEEIDLDVFDLPTA